jgi:two-component system, NarL family, invasion response regulator UvrY
MDTSKIKIALVDDHQLIRKGLRLLFESFGKFEIIFEAANGKDLIHWLTTITEKPDIIVVDVAMPIMDGFETASAITGTYNGIKIVALSVYDDMQSVNKMIESGAHAYLLKDAAPNVVLDTLLQVHQHGFYYSQHVIDSIMQSKLKAIEQTEIKRSGIILKPIDTITAREKEFIKLCCSELTYKEIADRMSVSQRTVDGYREAVFSKLDLKSRTGIVLFAFHQGLA